MMPKRIATVAVNDFKKCQVAIFKKNQYCCHASRGHRSSQLCKPLDGRRPCTTRHPGGDIHHRHCELTILQPSRRTMQKRLRMAEQQIIG